MAISCKQCSTQLDDCAAACTHCGAALPVPLPPQIETTDPSPQAFGVPSFSTGSDLEGIGGWLILVALGLAAGPFLLVRGIYTDLHFLYGGQFQSGLARYPGLVALILFEAVSNSIFLLGLIALNFLFYRKKRTFPGWMITYLAFNCSIILIDHLGALRYSPHTASTALVRSIVGVLIWIPYYLRSERVKVTFVH